MEELACYYRSDIQQVLQTLSIAYLSKQTNLIDYIMALE